MNFFEKIISFLDGRMETPSMYGWLHILSIFVVVIATFFIVKYFRKSDERVIRKITLICWIIMVILEIYKQIDFSFQNDNGIASWNYPWYIFPFQFCSSPLYVLPFIAFLKNSKVRDCCITFMATFSLFGGLAVMIYPGDVYTTVIGVNIQTMVHHGIQVVLGILFFIRIVEKFNYKRVLEAAIVFGGLLVTALVLNVSAYHLIQSMGIEETFNMFFISPYFDCTLPILSIIQPNVPYIIFLMIYAFGFILVAYIVYYLVYGIYRIVLKVRKHANKKRAIN